MTVEMQTPASTAISDLSGGLKLPRFKPGLSASGKIEQLRLPSHVTIPLWDYHRNDLKPFVSVGETVEQGQPIAMGVVASCHGVVESIEPCISHHPSALSINSVKIKVDANATFKHQLYNEEPLITYERLHACAIYGLGGAGYSTHDKIDSLANAAVETLIVNAVECEPLVSCDEAILISESDAVVKAVVHLANKVVCRRCIIAIENDKQAAIDALEKALTQLNTGRSIDIIKIDPVYPSGAERLLVERLTGQRLSHKQYPSQLGILCLNVSTVLAVEQARLGYAMVSRVITISGDRANNATNVSVQLGTSIGDVLRFSNNSVNPATTRVRLGGPLSGFDISDLSIPVTAMTNSIQLQSNVDRSTEQPCIRCGACSDVCPVNLLPQQLHSFVSHEVTAKIVKLGIHDCIECGCCDAVCPSRIPLTETFRFGKGLLQKESKDSTAANLSNENPYSKLSRVQQIPLPML